MYKYIRFFVSPPAFEGDEEKTRQAEFLIFLNWTIAIGALLFSIVWGFISTELTYRLIFVAPAFLLSGIGFWLIKIKKIKAASWILVSGVWLIFFISAAFNGGIRTPAAAGSIILVLFAGLLLGRTVALVFAGVSMLANLGLAFVETNGMLPPVEQYVTPLAHWTALTAYLVIAALLLSVAIKNSQDSLARAQQELMERKQAEAALRDAEFRYRILAEKIPVVTYRDAPDIEGTNLYISPQIENLLGYPPEAFAKNPRFWQEIIHPDDKSRTMRELAKYIQENKRSAIEYRLKAMDGRWVWVRDEADLVFDDNGKALFVQGTFSDITDRKQAEEDLRASEEKFNKAFYFSPVAMAISSPTSGYMDVNEAFLKLIGWRREEVINRKAREIGMWLDREVQQEAIARLEKEGQIQDFEFRFQRNSGEIGFGLASLTHLRVNQEDCALSSIIDMTVRKNSEEALRLSEEKFQKAFVSSPSPMLIDSPTKGILNVNHAFEILTGFEREEVRGKHAFEVGLWAQAEERQHAIDTVRQKGALHEYEFQFVKKSGEIRVGSLSVDLIDIEGEKCYLASFQDITSRKQAERTLKGMNIELENRVKQRTSQLEAAIKELESFSYSISHDLRAPLRAINGFSNLLTLNYYEHLPPEAQRLQRLVQENALKMGELIDNLLQFSRLGRAPIIQTKVNLAELALEVWESLAYERENRNIEFSVTDLPLCYGDTNLLRQVLMNLLGNATKFTRAQPIAFIELGHTLINKQETYYIKDNGVGFEMEYADKLFGVFQRLHAEHEFEGTGVGLAIVQRIIQRHGGRIWAEAHPNQGATFFFTLPLSPATK